MNLNDFSKWLQYNKEWKIEGGLNTFRTHCIYIQKRNGWEDIYLFILSTIPFFFFFFNYLINT